jgi:ornithine cyclodeaminase/alanine dehydrogenase
MSALRFVAAEAAQSVLQWNEMIDRLARAYGQPIGRDTSPPRVLARGGGAWLRCLVAVPPSGRYMGTKVFGLSGAKTVNYLIALFEQKTALLAGLVDGCHITSMRTAATSALAADRLVRRDRPVSVGVLGSGQEAKAHVQALAAVRKLSSLKVYSPTPARRDAFAAQFGSELGIACSAVGQPRDAVADMDVVIAAARSHDESPILYGDWLAPAAMVISIGSTLPEQREIDASVVAACDLIVCDNVEEVVKETGDMIAAVKAGIAFDSKLVSLNDLVMGKAEDVVARARRRMFKSVGSALQDVVVAELAFDRAAERGLAADIPIEFFTKKV